MRIGIIGTGRVGQAIANGLSKTDNEVRFGSRDPGKAQVADGTPVASQREVAAWAEAVILAVPYSAAAETVQGLDGGILKDKILVDATNVLSPTRELALGFTTSGAEELARLAPQAQVVKAFNTVFARNMSTGKVAGERLALFVAGDSAPAKESVMRLGREIGFDPVDAGPLKAARYLEPMAVLSISLAFNQKLGPGIGYRLVREPA